jgi:hypothetical protein
MFCITFSQTYLQNSLKNLKINFSGLFHLFRCVDDKLVIAQGDKDLQYEACSLHYT